MKLKLSAVIKLLKKILKFDTPQKAVKEIITKSTNKKLTLIIKRKYYTPTSTIGELWLNHKFECYTLEDEDKLQQGERKIYGETAIPVGSYEIDITYSPRFKTKLPLLKKVRGFKGVRIHPGNTAKDTEGCILVGQTIGKNFIGRSRRAFNALFTKLQQAKKEKRKIIIHIK